MDNPSTGTIQEAMQRLGASPEAVEESELEQPTDEPAEPAIEGDEAQAEVEEVEGEASDEDQPEPETYEVTVNGEPQRVTLEDLRKGYMMQSDYTSKTQQVAEGRKALEEERQSFAEKVAVAEEIARLETEDLESAEALELKDLDPQAYYERKERVEAKQKRLESLRAERDEQAAAKRAEFIREQQALVTEKIPEWIDPKAVEKDVQRMSAMWTRDGLTAEEMQSEAFTHHLLLVYSRKAALYDELMSAKPEEKKVRQAPKASAPGTATSNEQTVSKRQRDLRDRARQSGKMRDAQQAIEALIKG